MDKTRALEILKEQLTAQPSTPLTPLLQALYLYFQSMDGGWQLTARLSSYCIDAIDFFRFEKDPKMEQLRADYIERNIDEYLLRNRSCDFIGEDACRPEEMREERLRLYRSTFQNAIPALPKDFEKEVERSVFTGGIIRCIQKTINDELYYAVESIKKPQQKDGQ